ncbi:MAG: hypothetical protein HUU31_22355, partial [Anaerolineae bacterium]|nr:hypothetical protein [Anaerolineae bacterium]
SIMSPNRHNRCSAVSALIIPTTTLASVTHIQFDWKYLQPPNTTFWHDTTVGVEVRTTTGSYPLTRTYYPPPKPPGSWYTEVFTFPSLANVTGVHVWVSSSDEYDGGSGYDDAPYPHYLDNVIFINVPPTPTPTATLPICTIESLEGQFTAEPETLGCIVPRSQIEQELQDNYHIVIRGSMWADEEVLEIYYAALSMGRAFQEVSQQADPPIFAEAAAFRRVMVDGDTLPYIVLIQENHTSFSHLCPPPPLGGSEPDLCGFDVELPDLAHSGETRTIRLPPLEDTAEHGCKTYQGTGASAPLETSVPRTVWCNGEPSGYGAVGFTRYVAVHELAHIFDNRSAPPVIPPATAPIGLLHQAIEQMFSGDGCNASIFSTAFVTANRQLPVECVRILDAANQVVMGRIANVPEPAWRRGERGWGSGPDTVFTDFQQHPLDIPIFASESGTTQVNETAADMLLNWVYRRNTNHPPTYLTQVPGTWHGFNNLDWSNNAMTANNDSRFPGDARDEWMNIVVNAIFSYKGW